MNERDGAVITPISTTPIAATDPRQDDYDIWLGPGHARQMDSLEPARNFKRALPGWARQVGPKPDAYLGMYPGGLIYREPRLVPVIKTSMEFRAAHAVRPRQGGGFLEPDGMIGPTRNLLSQVRHII